MLPIKFPGHQVRKALITFKSFKSKSLDGILGVVLKTFAPELVHFPDKLEPPRKVFSVFSHKKEMESLPTTITNYIPNK